MMLDVAQSPLLMTFLFRAFSASKTPETITQGVALGYYISRPWR